MLIDHFHNKSNKSIETNKNSNRKDGFSEDTDIECAEHDEKLVKKRKEEIENNFLYEVDKTGSK